MVNKEKRGRINAPRRFMFHNLPLKYQPGMHSFHGHSLVAALWCLWNIFQPTYDNGQYLWQKAVYWTENPETNKNYKIVSLLNLTSMLKHVCFIFRNFIFVYPLKRILHIVLFFFFFFFIIFRIHGSTVACILPADNLWELELKN